MTTKPLIIFSIIILSIVVYFQYQINSLESKLSDSYAYCKNQTSVLSEKISELESKTDNLSNEQQELTDNYDNIQSQYDDIQSQYDDLESTRNY